MKFSRNWLQTYIKEPLPEDKTLEEVITFNAFEVEEVLHEGGDTIFDIKVLPNRAHDALGHRAMARDIAALCNLTFIDPTEYYHEEGDTKVAAPTITIDDTKACTRFMSVRIDGVKITESPEWLRTALTAIGQRSINSIVDITNYVQYGINKPMHAYDAALVSGNTLSARYARVGETLTTLDDKELTLDEKTLVIADTEKPLGLAGIKGGKFSGVSAGTTSLIIESANFNSALVRKTTQKYGVRTDSSKRFENEISDALVEEGLRMTIALIKKLNPKAKVSVIVDVGNKPAWNYVVAFSKQEVNSLLGTSYSDTEVEKALERLGFSYTKKTLRTCIEERIKTAKNATYKNPSSMREDAPHAFSCSSFISYLFNGVWQPSISIDKYVYGEHLSQDQATWGDLVFSNTGEGRIYEESVSFLSGTKVEGGIDHVGLYVDEGKVLHISRANNVVKEEVITEAKQFKGNVLFARVTDIDEERYFVTIPSERLDLRIKEDVIEEIARVQGLSSIKGVLPTLAKKGLPHKRLYYEMKIKNIMLEHGYSEIYTYTFGNKGEVTIMKALMDKKKLRTNLSDGVTEALSMNLHNAPLLGIDTVKVFEFGNVFTKETETRHIALAVDDGKKKSNFMDDAEFVLSAVKRALGVETLHYDVVSSKPCCIEIDFDTLIASLPEPSSYEPLTQTTSLSAYASVSPYPFIARDIAVWVPAATTWEDIHTIAVQGSDSTVVRIDCFDTFTKEVEGKGKMTSYAFRLVMQSKERTLTDEEANKVADNIYTLLKDKGYEIR